MANAVRKGDSCTGHGSYPSRNNDEGSPNVFINGLPAHREGDHWVTHCNGLPACHDSTAGKGSPNVFVNGKPKMRTGDPVNCGGTIASGSPNVFIN